MLEIRIHGGGGQGAQVACKILADAFLRSGSRAQALPACGGERQGAPVTASIRVDDRPIPLRCDIARPHHALILDPTLLADVGAACVEEGGTVVVNSPSSPCGWMPLAARVVAVDATAIARRAGLGPIVATAVIGAFAGVTGLVSLDDLVAAVEHGSPLKKQEHVAACTAAYLEAANGG
ncbi:MAG TPA: 2-oxoacid:acceptor oxidoreductase family protein [Methylomirabilota bacterium]|jgi:pyruvate ferredoxin oxidoreductase gamma subunit|nr:2-oxoacid:acceptor oxidoreductase family protein [Methylomirabilota bacterium]